MIITLNSIGDTQIPKGTKINLDFQSNKVRRNIEIPDEDDDEEQEEQQSNKPEEEIEDPFFKDLHQKLREIEVKYKRRPDEIADIFVKVSGDLENVKRVFEGQIVPMWTYLEDLALARPESSMEFKCLVESKGKEEIEKRRSFLLKTK